MSALIVTQNQVKLGTSFALPTLHPVNAWDAPSVPRAPHSSGAVSVASTNGVERRTVDRAEPCFITNDSSYVHEQVYWVNAVLGKEEKDQQLRRNIELFLFVQGIVCPIFTLNHPSNLTNLDPRLHSAMDKFAMFAVTCSQATLDALAEIIQKENKVARERAEEGTPYIRNLKILSVSESAEYEVVVLQPKHFLPNKSCLTRYPTLEGKPKLYQVDSNGVLRLSPLTEDSPRYPSFRFTPNRQRQRGDNLNPYLVILSAEIKFRQYRASRSFRANAPRLDAEYEALMTKTIDVADLLYWEPVTGANARRFFSEPGEGMEGDDYESQDSRDSEIGFMGEDIHTGGSTLKGRPDVDWRSLLSGGSER
ncbi:hypothetical protein GALMADRAFT_229754 [Galerina marginata CBS 339.88]|uniref:Uncharacterized protein n=1 Tax=Galerina marginata (strain CBS 339.88) TaxID=685588 RepID=A0A067SJN2_GALM3|nr:hypothetical protein GALMADRAFT_229754 [Galerina marginata CBS 339.88]